MSEHLIVLSLALLNLGQLLFWGIYTHKLINKLMSKNFLEYDQIANKPAQEEPQRVSFDEYEDAHEEQEILRELNGMVKVN